MCTCILPCARSRGRPVNSELEDLKPRHVLVADRFLDTVTSLVQSLPGADQVHEKGSKRRCIAQGGELSSYALAPAGAGAVLRGGRGVR